MWIRDFKSFFWSDPVGSPTIDIEIKPAYVAVFPLDELEEGDHVGTAEVVGRLQTREEASPRQPLEVVLADVLKSELHPELHPISDYWDIFRSSNFIPAWLS